jgi:hypothetical protein
MDTLVSAWALDMAVLALGWGTTADIAMEDTGEDMVTGVVMAGTGEATDTGAAAIGMAGMAQAFMAM